MARKGNSGTVVLRSWTPAKAAAAARRRIDKVETLLLEVAYLYGGVDNSVIDKCDQIAASLRGEDSLDAAIQYALDAGAQL